MMGETGGHPATDSAHLPMGGAARRCLGGGRCRGGGGQTGEWDGGVAGRPLGDVPNGGQWKHTRSSAGWPQLAALLWLAAWWVAAVTAPAPYVGGLGARQTKTGELSSPRGRRTMATRMVERPGETAMANGDRHRWVQGVVGSFVSVRRTGNTLSLSFERPPLPHATGSLFCCLDRALAATSNLSDVLAWAIPQRGWVVERRDDRTSARRQLVLVWVEKTKRKAFQCLTIH